MAAFIIFIVLINIVFVNAVPLRARSRRVYGDIVDQAGTSDAKCSSLINCERVVASSEYSYAYAAHNALKGPGFAWSSRGIDAWEVGQWLEIVFKDKKVVVSSMSLRGDVNYPDYTPTKVVLQGLKNYEWTDLLIAYKVDNEINGKVPSDKKAAYDAYRIVVSEMVWRQTKKHVWGYAEISSLQLCWD